MPHPLYLVTAGLLAVCLSACTKVPSQGNKSYVVHSGQDLTAIFNLQMEYDEFLLEGGTYSANAGGILLRDNIVVRKKDSASEVRITTPLEIWGDNNILDGLTWDGDLDSNIRESDPGTLAVSGRNNVIRNCTFRNMRMTDHGTCIITIGRRKKNDHFINTTADGNTIENCTFYNWGLRGQPKNSTESSTCIAVGEENDKGHFTGTIIRNNQFLEGPYQQYGYNAAIKVFNATLIENNLFYKGQECLEIKYGNSTIRGNTIHRFSGYNILANRLGKNNLYENNTVYDVRPADRSSSSQGFMIWEAGNTVYRKNLIYDCDKAGLILGRQSVNNSLMQYVLIENNSFAGNKTGIYCEDLTAGPRHIFIIKNIFYGGSSVAKMHMLSGFDSASLDNYSDNIFYDNILNDGDSSSRMADPGFTDAAEGNYALQPNSPACGYGAIPCAAPLTANAYAVTDNFSENIVVYPTKNKYVFHVGLVGLDIAPLMLEIDAADGKVLLRRGFPGPAPNNLKVIENIDMTKEPATSYMLKITTASGVISKRISI